MENRKEEKNKKRRKTCWAETLLLGLANRLPDTVVQAPTCGATVSGNPAACTCGHSIDVVHRGVGPSDPWLSRTRVSVAVGWGHLVSPPPHTLVSWLSLTSGPCCPDASSPPLS